MLHPSQITQISRLTRTTKAGIRSFSVAIPARKAGDTGSPKPRGFLAEKDAFTRREAAQEGLYIKAHEAEKLEMLLRKMKEQRQQLDQHIAGLERRNGDGNRRIVR